MIEQALNSVWQFFADKWAALIDPWIAGLILFEWWALFVLFVAVCMLIGFFLPFKWIRAGLGGMVLLALAFVIGGTKMYRDLKPHVRPVKRVVKPERPDDDNRPWVPW